MIGLTATPETIHRCHCSNLDSRIRILDSALDLLPSHLNQHEETDNQTNCVTNHSISAIVYTILNVLLAGRLRVHAPCDRYAPGTHTLSRTHNKYAGNLHISSSTKSGCRSLIRNWIFMSTFTIGRGKRVTKKYERKGESLGGSFVFF